MNVDCEEDQHRRQHQRHRATSAPGKSTAATAASYRSGYAKPRPDYPTQRNSVEWNGIHHRIR